jgi:Ala-tRNA(Pro) deacylase
MGCREELEAYLRESKVPFQAQHHAVAYTAQEVAAAEHVPGRMLAKVVIVQGDGKLSMLVLPAPAGGPGRRRVSRREGGPPRPRG